MLSLLLLCACGLPWLTETLKLINNGYEDFVVAINEDVPEDTGLFIQIQNIMTDASAYLYLASRQRAYIRSVKILVPNTWSKNNAKYTDPKDESFDNAHIRIDKANPTQGNNPYTFQPGQCGDPGQYIHLTPEYVMDAPGIYRELNWGNPGRVVVHEFAHLRYGVFDEYGTAGNIQHPEFYLSDKGRIMPTSCTTEFTWHFQNIHTDRPCKVNTTNNMPEDNCTFIVNETTSPAIASIMFMQSLKNVTHFCESIPADPHRQHNHDAPNMHNKMCPGRGTWDVIKQHPDFRTSNPSRLVNDTTPTFTYLYNTRGFWFDGTEKCGRRVVLLLDLSGSMKKNDRWFKQRQTADKFINDILPIGSNIGVVTFSDDAHDWTPMTPLRHELIKKQVAGGLPLYKDVRGGTAIGLGIQSALNMLSKTGDSKTGRILLITDGEENRSPTVDSIMKDILTSEVVVHTIAYGQQASKTLADLSAQTGGLYAYFSEGNASSSLDSSIHRLLDDVAVCKERRQIEIYRSTTEIPSSGTDYSGNVYIDDTVGLDTVFVFTLPRTANVDIRLRSPNGHVFDSTYSGYHHDGSMNIIRFKLQIQANETGMWTYTVRSSTAGPATVGITVTSKPRDRHNSYEFLTWLSDTRVNATSPPVVYAHVHKGYSPVIYADVRISIEKPDGQVEVVKLFDNGIPPDNTKNDGVYTSYVTAFNSNERYSLDAEVNNIPGKTLILVAADGSGRAYSRIKNKSRKTVLQTVTTNFSRTSSPGAMDITGVTPGRDLIPPAAIYDLMVEAVNAETYTLTLKWTAPGDDLNHGTATRYEIRFGRSFQEMRESFHDAMLIDATALAGPLVPHRPGEQQIVDIDLSSHGNLTTLIFAVKTFDDAGLHSELSNLVSVSLKSKADIW
ncbi:calcium-activated chloride channel regulator 1-like [Haliotis rubra]|uniref:calcium-activated chloride channel regulator 1-like n=1 Tax=Haliotis rubra TaxID=36100 RepID=UPI001EE5B91A|nr:calcium-activated chloride channel regulator 1-like [Haliotis rubra]